MTFSKTQRRVIKLLTILSLTLCLLFLGSNTGWSLSRLEFGQLLRMVPPAGPPETYGNVILQNRGSKRRMAPVIFSHWSHRARYKCKVCHMELNFSMPRGGSVITRGGNLAGRHCGACHNGKIAFSVRYEEPRHCKRCHQDPPQDMKEQFKAFAKKLPRTEEGNTIDWVKALRNGDIKPKESLYEDGLPPMKLPDALKKPLSLGVDSGRSTVFFSHESHVAWLDCSNCHPDIFNIKKRGTESFSMDKNLYGWFCGTCHMRVAFPMTACKRCHPNMTNVR